MSRTRNIFSRLIAVAVVLVAAGGLWASSGASDAIAAGASNARLDALQGKGDCAGPNTNFPVVGFANLHRVGDQVTVEFHVKGGRPNTEYHIQLWGAPCNFLAEGDTVMTNSNGVANGSVSAAVDPAATLFFATAWDIGPSGFEWNDTVMATLP